MKTKLEIQHYFFLYLIFSGIFMLVCDLDLYTNISYKIMPLLIDIAELPVLAVVIVGAIRTLPKNKWATRRIWHYFLAMSYFLMFGQTLIDLCEQVWKLL